MELFVSFSEIMHYFRKTRVRFALVVLIFGVLFGLAPLKLVHHVYTASTTFSLTASVPNNADSNYYLQYTGILNSRVLSSIAMAQANELVTATAQQVGVDPAEIVKITAEQQNSAPVVKLSLQTTDAEKAALLSDTAAQILTQQLVQQFPSPALTATLSDKAMPVEAESRKAAMAKTGILGLAIGFILYVCFGIVMVLSDRTVRNSRFAEESFHTTLLAELGSGDVSDACRKLRAAALHQSQGSRSFLISEVCEKNGGEAVAAGFATALAQTGKQVLLLDANLREPTLAADLGVTPGKTLADVLSGACAAEDAAISVPAQSGLRLLPGAPLNGQDPADAFAGEKFSELLKKLTAAYDYVVIAAPAEARYPDAENIASLAQAVILSVRYGSTPFERLGDSFHRMTAAGGKVIGFVTTNA